MSVYYWAADGSTTGYNLGAGSLFTADVGTEYVASFVITSGNQIQFFKDYGLLWTVNGSWNQPFYVWLGYFTGSASSSVNIKDMEVEWIRIRPVCHMRADRDPAPPDLQAGVYNPSTKCV